MANKFGLRTEITLNITLLLGAALLFGGFLILKLTERELLDQRVASLAATTQMVGSVFGDMLGSEVKTNVLQQRVDRLLQPLPSGTTIGLWKWSADTLKPVHLHGPDKASLDTVQRLLLVRYLPEPQFTLSYSNTWLPLGHAAPSYYKVTMPLYGQSDFVGFCNCAFPSRVSGAVFMRLSKF